jgi:hypothetical protein
MPGGSTSTTTGSQSGTQTANLDPLQSGVNQGLFQQILAALKLGPNVSQGQSDLTSQGINQTFNAAEKGTASNLAASGFGNSGKVPQNIESTGVARAQAQGQGAAQNQQNAQQNFMQMIQSALQFDLPRSFSSSGTSSGTSTPSLLSSITGILGAL